MRPLYDLAVMAIKWAAQVLGASTNTAALLIADRVGYNVLVGITRSRRNRPFVFRDYLTFFRWQP